ncbi:hypothetical protein AKJ09_10587 [Labilithrix luteola]|uniref:DUF2029 domain-containing protein n=1 Tax=Labilithrix luteola TaxID=1391654 RepID=A0A0K1QDT7_9BACT|nr:DUF6311 domain-containing protein [Labilithrix luteola]AKV03924.1 hypothetical protein AKJ09_10587 [Labilithrix luteola]
MIDVVAGRWERFAAAFFGFAYFVALTDTRVLDPRRFDVLARGDGAYHVLARNFAQWDGWHFPLSRIDNYFWPVGTSAVFTDANPWITLVTKAILPRDAPPLQFVGPWLALCFVLQGWFGARLTGVITKERALRALGGALFVVAPILAFRLAHEALCAHWILLLVIEIALTPAEPEDAARSRRLLAGGAAVLAFAAGVHPTLLAMALPLAVVAVFRHVRNAGRVGAVFAVAMMVGPLLVWLALGSIARNVQTETFGFGHFSANVLSLLDPLSTERSTILPPLPHGDGQYEGFGYLGVGVLALLALVFAHALVRAARAREKPWRFGRWGWAVFAAAGASAIFAFSSRVLVGQHLLVDLSRAYVPLHAVANAFRSSGRFIWPLHYVLVMVAIAGVVRVRSDWARGMLATALFVQLLDAHRVDGRHAFTLHDDNPAPSPTWALARGAYEHMALEPPRYDTNGLRCEGDDHPAETVAVLGPIAARQHLTFDSGQAARVDERALTEYCAKTARERHDGVFDAATIFVAAPSTAADLRSRPELTCGRLDGRDVCVRADRPTDFSRALQNAQ